jgi:hypothetical protein
MKLYFLVFLLVIFYSCSNPEQKIHDNSVEQLIMAEKEKELKIFSPNTNYFTSPLVDKNAMWEEEKYFIFQTKYFEGPNKEKFELLDIYGNGNNLVVFNELIDEKDSIKHIILDTLLNYSSFADSLTDKGTSVGVMNKEDLLGIETKGLDQNAIIAVIETKANRSFKNEIDSAVASAKKNKQNPFEVINIRNPSVVLRAWFANGKTKKIEVLKK